MDEYLTQDQIRARKTRRAITIIGAIALVVLAVWGVAKLSSMSQEQIGSELGGKILADENRIGNPESAIELIEYSDLQCPACASYNTIIKRLLDEYQDRINFAYRHFPLKDIHPQATLAAKAAEAAGKQGKFWEMLDKQFANQSQWAANAGAETLMLGYASELGLNEAQFVADMNSDEAARKVDSDYRTGIAAGVNATPTFFLNGTKLANPGNYEQFKSLIDNLLQQQTQN